MFTTRGAAWAYRCDERDTQEHGDGNQAREESADGAAHQHELSVRERRPVAGRRFNCIRGIALALDMCTPEQAGSALEDGAVDGTEGRNRAAAAPEAVYEAATWGACAQDGG